MEFKWSAKDENFKITKLKVLSYWNLNVARYWFEELAEFLKVLSYWNLNKDVWIPVKRMFKYLKYYHIGI